MITVADEARMLAESSVLRVLPEAKLRQLAFVSERFSFPEDRTIIETGEEGACGFLLLEGEVEVTVIPVEGEPLNVTMGPGFLIGDHALIAGGTYRATVRSKGPIEVLRIGRDALVQLLNGDKEATEELLAALLHRKEQAEKKFSIKLD